MVSQRCFRRWFVAIDGLRISPEGGPPSKLRTSGVSTDTDWLFVAVSDGAKRVCSNQPQKCWFWQDALVDLGNEQEELRWRTSAK